MKTTPSLLPLMLKELRTKSGFSADLIRREIIRKGFAVSVHKEFENKIEGFSRSDSDTFTENGPIAGYLQRYTLYNLTELAKPGNVLGAWLDDDGTLWLDISTIVASTEEAVRLARLNDQVAYYDFQKSEVVYV